MDAIWQLYQEGAFSNSLKAPSWYNCQIASMASPSGPSAWSKALLSTKLFWIRGSRSTIDLTLSSFQKLDIRSFMSYESRGPSSSERIVAEPRNDSALHWSATLE